MTGDELKRQNYKSIRECDDCKRSDHRSWLSCAPSAFLGASTNDAGQPAVAGADTGLLAAIDDGRSELSTIARHWRASRAVTLCIILIPSFRSHSLSLAQGVDIDTLGVGSALWAQPVKPGVVPAGAGNEE